MLPTLSNRIKALDLLRGIAILGILLANIKIFASPVASELVMFVPASQDTWLDAVLAVVVTGKFRSMLAILFGVGIFLQYRKRSQTPGNWPAGYFKRAGYLCLIGFVHAILIWWGDILFLYSLLAFATCLLASLSSKVLWWIIGALGTFTLLLSGFVVLVTTFAPGTSEAPEGLMAMFTAKNEIAVHAHGTWLEQLQFRGVMFVLNALSATMMVPLILPLFVLGLLVGRDDVLRAPSRHPRWRNLCLWIGFGVGLPLNLLALFAFARGWLFEFTLMQEFVLAPILALGYLMLGAIWAESGKLSAIASALAKVGQVALTSYLMQSVLATFVFYSWGLGLFGHVSTAQSLGVVAAIWTANIIFAQLWLAKFDIGPVEWVWRSLTEGRRQPWRAVAAPPAAPPPTFDL
ncbi:MAG TPA: DUF418 domain-containing protein [Fimbriimonadaceae bacterium]|nr:DUF418 domain-containing protein [Fimbriimonadaceae bacterium]